MTVLNLGTEGKSRQCAEGILDSYQQYAVHQESPTDFHTWVNISMIATAMGRNCFVSMGMWATYPNMYLVLVGESAITHKSTAIKMGVEPMQEALPDIPYLGDCMTAQALTSVLAEITAEGSDAVGVIEGSELSVLLDNSKKDDVLIKRLTDFWDCPNRRVFRTIGRGKEEVKNVCINLLGGSTPKWLRSSVPEEALEGGFFSRLLLVQRPPKGEKNPRPMVSAAQKEALSNVRNDLQCIAANMSGEFVMEDSAEQLFDEWYHEYNHPAKATGFMRGYFGRKGDFMLKVAMCLSASHSDEMIITYEDIMQALKLLNENEKHTEGLVKYMGTTQEGQKSIKVLNTIKRGMINMPPEDQSSYSNEDRKNENWETVPKRGMSHRDVQQRLSHQVRKDELALCLETLIDAGEIEMKIVGQRGRKVYLLLSTDATEVE